MIDKWQVDSRQGFDDTGHIRYANAAVEHVFGRLPLDVLGQPFTLLAPDPATAFDRYE